MISHTENQPARCYSLLLTLILKMGHMLLKMGHMLLKTAC